MARDENQRAWDAVRQATGDSTGAELLADIIGTLREGIADGASDQDLALRLWPRLESLLSSIERPEVSAAVALGRRGGQKGGRARAAKLTPKKRAAIAKKAARARWAKRGTSDDL